MKTLITSLIVILSINTTAFAESKSDSKIHPRCIEMFEFCVELRKQLIRDMIDHGKSGSDFPFIEPLYTDWHCTQDLIKMEKNGECKNSN